MYKKGFCFINSFERFFMNVFETLRSKQSFKHVYMLSALRSKHVYKLSA